MTTQTTPIYQAEDFICDDCGDEVKDPESQLYPMEDKAVCESCFILEEKERTAARMKKLRGMRTAELKNLRQDILLSGKDPSGQVADEIRRIILGRANFVRAYKRVHHGHPD